MSVLIFLIFVFALWGFVSRILPKIGNENHPKK